MLHRPSREPRRRLPFTADSSSAKAVREILKSWSWSHRMFYVTALAVCFSDGSVTE